MKAAAAMALVLLGACTPGPKHPFEDALGPPPVETATHKTVYVTAGSDGVDVGGSISKTRGNVTYGIGF